MTREEQIIQASIDYQLSTNPRAIGGDDFADIARKMNVNQNFIAGARYADQTMIEKACEWLKNHLDEFWCSHFDDDKAFIEAFKKAMKGGEK